MLKTERFHTFAYGEIYHARSNTRQIQLRWVKPAAHEHVKGLHQYTPEQERVFDEYIKRVNTTITTDEEFCQLADGRFSIDGDEYCVRGMCIYRIECLHRLLKDAAETIYNKIVGNARDWVDPEFTQMASLPRLYSTQDLLTIWSLVMIQKYNHNGTVLQLYVLNADERSYNVILHKNYITQTNLGHTYTYNWASILDKFIRPRKNEFRLQNQKKTSKYIADLKSNTNISPSSEFTYHTYSAGIHNKKGTCSAIACMQFLYHMPDIVTICNRLCDLNNCKDDLVYLLDTMHLHVSGMRTHPDYNKIEKLFKLFYDKINTVIDTAWTKETYIKDRVFQVQQSSENPYEISYMILLFHMLNRLSAESPDLAMYIGGVLNEKIPQHYPAIVEHIAQNRQSDNTYTCPEDKTTKFSTVERGQITNALKHASTDQPYKIIYLSHMTTDNYSRIGGRPIPVKYVPVVVENENTATAYRLIGAIIRAPKHVYYIDLANRVIYDNDLIIKNTPAVMFRKTIEDCALYISGVKRNTPYEYMLDSAEFLLYVRDEI